MFAMLLVLRCCDDTDDADSLKLGQNINEYYVKIVEKASEFVTAKPDAHKACRPIGGFIHIHILEQIDGRAGARWFNLCKHSHSHSAHSRRMNNLKKWCVTEIYLLLVRCAVVLPIRSSRDRRCVCVCLFFSTCSRCAALPQCQLLCAYLIWKTNIF